MYGRSTRQELLCDTGCVCVCELSVLGYRTRHLRLIYGDTSTVHTVGKILAPQGVTSQQGFVSLDT